MAKDKDNNFVASPPLQVIIPYSEYEKVVNMALKMEEMERQYKHMEERYDAIFHMFGECLDAIREIREFVKDS